MSETTLLIGIFDNLEEMLTAGRTLREKGLRVVDAISPFPTVEVEALFGEEESPIRYFTLLGGLLGCCGGFALTIGVALRHGIMTGGKPVVALPPFLIIAFEMTILLGALATMTGFFLKSRLPRISRGRPRHKGFTEDHFGLVVACGTEEVDEVRDQLAMVGALEVREETV